MRNYLKPWIKYGFKLHSPHANKISQPCVDGLALPKTLGLKMKQQNKHKKTPSKQTNEQTHKYTPTHSPQTPQNKTKKEGEKTPTN